MWHMLCTKRNQRDTTVQLSYSISFIAVSLLSPGGFSPLQAHANMLAFFLSPHSSLFQPQLLPPCFSPSQLNVLLWSSILSSFPSKAFKHCSLYRSLCWNAICLLCISFPRLLWRRSPLLKFVPLNSLLSLEEFFLVINKNVLFLHHCILCSHSMSQHHRGMAVLALACSPNFSLLLHQLPGQLTQSRREGNQAKQIVQTHKLLKATR